MTCVLKRGPSQVQPNTPSQLIPLSLGALLDNQLYSMLDNDSSEFEDMFSLLSQYSSCTSEPSSRIYDFIGDTAPDMSSASLMQPLPDVFVFPPDPSGPVPFPSCDWFPSNPNPPHYQAPPTWNAGYTPFPVGMSGTTCHGFPSSSSQSDANEGVAVATGWGFSDPYYQPPTACEAVDSNSESGINQIPQTEGEEFFQLLRSSDILNPFRCNSRAEAYRKISQSVGSIHEGRQRP